MNVMVTAKEYMAMTAKQLAEATKEFDEEFVADKTRPLTAKEKALWEKAKRKDGKTKTTK